MSVPLQIEWLIFAAFLCVALLYIWTMVRQLRLFRRAAFSDKRPLSGEGVSVVLIAHNALEDIKRNLPFFLMQDYPLFEVVVVDECSEDGSLLFLKEWQKVEPRLQVTWIDSHNKFLSTKRLAIHIGILAARFDTILLSDMAIQPHSSRWIRRMSEPLFAGRRATLGLTEMSMELKISSFSRDIWFDRFLRMGESSATAHPILGNVFNMGFKKHDYVASSCFVAHSQSRLGYEHDLIHHLGDAELVMTPESVVTLNRSSRREVSTDVDYLFAGMRWISSAERFRLFFDYFLLFCLFVALVACILWTPFLGVAVGITILLIILNVWLRLYLARLTGLKHMTAAIIKARPLAPWNRWFRAIKVWNRYRKVY